MKAIKLLTWMFCLLGTTVFAQNLDVDGPVKFGDLSGVNTRMVVANASGQLSTQALQPGYWTLNVIEGNVYRETGRVGIGTNDPQQTLHVNGTGLFGGVAIDNPNSVLSLTGDSMNRSQMLFFNRQAPFLTPAEAEITYHYQENILGFGAADFSPAVTDASVSIDVTSNFYDENTNGIFNIGKLNAKHLTFDGLGIQAKDTDPTKESNLFLNFYGKDVVVGGAGGTRLGVGTQFPKSKIHVKQVSVASDSAGIRIEHPTADTANWNTYVDNARDYNFSFNGNLKSYIHDTDGAYNIISDRRAKSDIVYTENILDKFLQLRPAQYRYKTASRSSSLSNGFIAQEVQQIFPEAVSEKNGFLALNYDAISVMAVQAIKEQHEIITAQQTEIEVLNYTLKDVLARLEQLENK